MTIEAESTIEQSFNSLFYDHIESFYPLLKQFEKANKKDIHTFRIWVKEFKIYLDLAEEFSNGNFKRKSIFKLIKPLYQSAGKLRTAQVNQDKIENLDLDSKSKEIISKLLKKEKKEQESAFISTASSFHLQYFYRSLHKLLVFLDEDFPDNQSEILKHFELNSITNIKDLISNHYQSETLHSIRKEIKVILFINSLKRRLKVEFSLTENYNQLLVSLEKHIGKWNNILSQLDWLEKIENKKTKSATNALKIPLQVEYISTTTAIMEQLNALIKLL